MPLPSPTPPNMQRPPTLAYATPQTNPYVRQVGLAQRRIMWIILGAILMTASFVGGAVITPTSGSAQIVVIGLLLVLRLAMIALMMIGVYQLASALRYGVASCVLYTIGMLVPLVSLIILLSLNQKATNVLRHSGIKVGLMGARLSDLPL
jgi:hypothetical protein